MASCIDKIKNCFLNLIKIIKEWNIAYERSLAKRKEELLTLSMGINLPNVKGRLILRKNEVCHCVCLASYDNKMMTTKHTKGSSALSVRVAKGILFKIGRSRSSEIKKEKKLSRVHGQLFITNKISCFLI